MLRYAGSQCRHRDPIFETTYCVQTVLSQLLKLSCRLARESWLFDWLGSAQLSRTKPTARLSLKKKPGWLRRLDSQLAPAPGAATTLRVGD